MTTDQPFLRCECGEPGLDCHQNASLIEHLANEKAKFIAFLRKRVGSAADAEDVFQQGLLRASEHISQLHNPLAIDAWFFRILRSILANEAEKQKLRQEEAGQFRFDEAFEAFPESKACSCTFAVLSELKAEYREILVEIDIKEQPIHQTAEQLGISENSANVRLFRARKAMKEGLLSKCGSCCSSNGCSHCQCD